jgi:uncharacterized protein with PQ loop repeat
MIYLYAKSKLKPLDSYLKQLAGCLFASGLCCYFLTAHKTLVLALTLNMTLFVFQFSQVKKILLTKDPKKVNHYMALACIFDAFVWTLYSVVVSDIYFLVLNVTAFTAGSL